MDVLLYWPVLMLSTIAAREAATCGSYVIVVRAVVVIGSARLLTQLSCGGGRTAGSNPTQQVKDVFGATCACCRGGKSELPRHPAKIEFAGNCVAIRLCGENFSVVLFSVLSDAQWLY
jgi:hypothetical protein